MNESLLISLFVEIFFVTHKIRFLNNFTMYYGKNSNQKQLVIEKSICKL